MSRDYKCDTYCPTPCGDYDMDAPNRTECVRAMSFCDCRPFWKTPACWLVTSLSVVLFISITRLIVLWVKKRGRKTATKILDVKRGSVGSISDIAISKKCDDLIVTVSDNQSDKSSVVETDKTVKRQPHISQSTLTDCE
ncbi:unnamed protein product [Orchesella dallaii]|uniref:Uncharacterized protein n=1 Tax=Orchesella dallaii TaxID=48710 RepID=A0ABP1RUY3_9HEXA